MKLLRSKAGLWGSADDGVGVAVVSVRPRAALQRGYLSGIGYAGEITGPAERARTPRRQSNNWVNNVELLRSKGGADGVVLVGRL